VSAVIDHASVRTDVPLAPLTTYKVGGNARWFIEPDDLEELRSVLLAKPDDVDLMVLGRGSNVVVSDEGFDGLVVKLGSRFAAIEAKPDGRIVAGGGTPLPVLARTAADAGRSGLGFFVGIPGSVGGAVRMNAGGHGSDTASVLSTAVVLDAATVELSTRPVGLLDLTYRSSNLSESDIVVQATFHTERGTQRELQNELREITRWRKENQPGGTLNAGSVFKNPNDAPAGAIIDDLGLKGESLGPVSVSMVHANFLVAEPQANAADIHRFVHTIRKTVYEATGRLLEPEIRFVGNFNDLDPT
jgi:UDP-N-acetylmuramate dehydrogenase